ncbi:UvrD-helicase domain-containing protein [Gaetbulibacter saemankumensis]|uniref:UvrD-helicase domain-containing protein n=1 Tax=Gaetbulibacter saemankumensis TaxID=311208 RepID=UPI00041D1729|nr:UvrD-helicase domain-containing protein [Gaetbulibacter saemankumensis]
MFRTPSFTIYNASAGSGKTFTLVKEYLKILFESKSNDTFKRILAITFTNKAVAEMKERIIDTLKHFSDEKILEHPEGMFAIICEELNFTPEVLHKKSQQILNTIMHNYAAFDISTIDGFTHKLIRTFAYDLKLPLNFEVELDQESLINEAVDSLISKAGKDKTLTKVLLDFAIEKADEDKSWDVAFDFNKIAKLLLNENDIPYILTLKAKTLNDFKLLKDQLRKDIKASEEHIKQNANDVLSLIENTGLEHANFSRSTLPNHFKKAAKLDLDTLYNNKLEENIVERKGIYNKSLNSDIANSIESILPEIELYYKIVKREVYNLKFLRAVYKNITPLSVINAINNELTSIKSEQNKMLISEFNTLISKEISNQPTPFIYERIGENFKHYFIDEFQDTSVLQWQNLIPLLDNALSVENGTTMLVGDAKQAIYRWRGGKAEQFIKLFNDDNPFQAEKSIENLPTNYRSSKQVVSFNNAFFKFLASEVFSNKTYQELYVKSGQEISKTLEGYVELTFLDIKSEDDRDALYCEEALKSIQTNLDQGYALKDICVLVRKKKEGVAIAKYLSTNNIPIISSETLLLYNAPEVGFINSVLELLIQPKNNEIKIKVLNYFCQLLDITNKHDFFTDHLNLSISELFKSLEEFNVFIPSINLLQLPLYDLAETIVRTFNLIEKSNAYVQFYLDIILDFTNKNGSDIPAFLDYFNKKKENLSIVSPQGQNAVQIMTIHKSKGLEFPVVIFPYADLDIYREIEPKEWFPIPPEKFQGFSHMLLNFNKDFEAYDTTGADIFNKHKSEQELDNINLLYVALTRASEQLFIISNKDVSTKGEVNTNRYSGLFISHLQHLDLWNNSQFKYSFGTPKEAGLTKQLGDTIFQNEFISTSKESHQINIVTKSGMLWDTSQEEAIEKGNLIHNLMAKIVSEKDIDSAIHEFISDGTINGDQANSLKDIMLQIVRHPKLENYFNDHHTVINERDIITNEGIILRPDRLVINSNNEAVIIDFKTGLQDKKHFQQLQSYQDVLEQMNLKVLKKILIYTNDAIQISEA